MSQVPWTRIREFKEEQERKKRREFEAAVNAAQFQVPGQQKQSQGQAPAQAKPFSERFKESYFKERLLFGAVVGAVTGAFFGGRKCVGCLAWVVGLTEGRSSVPLLFLLLTVDAVQGIKKGEAFGVMLNTLPAKAKFSAEHVGSAALVFSMYVLWRRFATALAFVCGLPFRPGLVV